MEPIPRNIRVYITSDGSRPFLDWLNSLKEPKSRAVIRARIDRLRLGNMGDYRSLRNGIFELRIHFGPGFRVYCGEDGHDLVIL